MFPKNENLKINSYLFWGVFPKKDVDRNNVLVAPATKKTHAMESILKKAYDPEALRTTGHELVDMLADYLKTVQTSPAEVKAIPYQPPAAALDSWRMRLEEGGEPMELFREVLAQSVKLHHPHYMGHQVCPPAPMAALAGLLGDFLNNGMAVYEMGMPGSAAEHSLLQAVGKAMGLGEGSGGFLTSGGTLANLTALLTARASRVEGDVWQEGSRQRLALMVSEEAHYCVDRAARIMGWGAEGIIKVPSDEAFRIRTDLLEAYYQQAVEQGIEVIAVVGSACSTAVGAFDDLAALADFSEKHGLWFHVDGAHGAALVFSPDHRAKLRGIERADSITMDFHKMLMTPTLTTALVYRQQQDSYLTFYQRADYLLEWAQEDEWYNLARRTFECTKLMLSMKAFVLWAAYGSELFRAYVDRVCGLGTAFAALIRAQPDFELLTEPDCNIVCYRWVQADKTPEQLDDLNRRLRQLMLEEGDFYLLITTIRGRVWMRSALTNPMTGEEELAAVLQRIREKAGCV